LRGDPVEAGDFRDAGHGEAHGVLADDPIHAEQPGIDAIAAKTVDVGVAPVAGEHAE